MAVEKPNDKVIVRPRHYADLVSRYMRPQAAMVALMGALLLGGTALYLIQPQIVRYFIDTARAGGENSALFSAGAAFIGITIVAQVVSVFADYTSAQVGWTATNNLRNDLARHCLRLDMSFHKSRTPGEMIERIDGDPTQLGSFFSRFVIDILGSVLLLGGALVLVAREDWRAGLALTLFAGVCMAVLFTLRNIATPYWKAEREASAQTFGFLEERLSGTEDIRTNNAKPYVMRRFHELMRTWYRKYRMSDLMGSMMFGSTIMMLIFGNALSLGVGAYLYINGDVTIGTVYLFLYYTSLLVWPINSLTSQLDSFQRATTSISRVVELTQAQSKVPDGPSADVSTGPLAVEFDRVSFSYGEGEAVLHDVSFTLAPGTVLGLLGRTGSGKTTMTRLLLRLYDPSSGAVRVGGRDVRELKVGALRERVKLVTQDVRLFQGTVRDNLTFFDPSIPDERMIEVIHSLGLSRWYESLPNGLDSELSSGGSGLSAGEGQLLAFARVFLRDAGVVILDEASSRLDRGTEQMIERAVDRLARGRTVIIIAHHLATVQRCDRIMVLEQGRIVEHGDRRALAADPSSRFARLLKTGLEEVLS
ncbi:MAG: ABC transporter ATP-binding protein [SAR202 cluster bacterium]|nr:ABC transporter ATP-binding protein [SAR202 cluster bacterium]